VTAFTRWLTAAVAGDAVSGSRIASARAALSNSMAITSAKASRDLRSLRAACHPMDTWSSCMPEDGIESTLAGVAKRFISETNAACAYWAIIRPESTPACAARNGGRPKLRDTSSIRSVRRSDIDATSATTMARKSSA